MKIINSKGPSIDPRSAPVEIKHDSQATPLIMEPEGTVFYRTFVLFNFRSLILATPVYNYNKTILMTTYGNNHNASESNHIVLSRWISNKDKNNDNHTSNICKEESNSNLRSSNSTLGGSWRRQFGVEGRWADRWWDVGSEMAWLSKVTVVTGGIWWSHPVNPHKST